MRLWIALGVWAVGLAGCVGTVWDDRDEGSGGAPPGFVPPPAEAVAVPWVPRDVFCDEEQANHACDAGGPGLCVWDAGVLQDGGAAWICLSVVGP